MKRNTSFLLFAVAAACLSPQRAVAHDLRIMVTPEDASFRVEAWFEGDIPAEKARITVTNAAGEILHSGTTDERGVWLFPKPGPGAYRIVVESTGHRDSAILQVPGEQTSADAVPTVITDSRLSQTLGLSIGLTLVLGGTAAFILIRRMKRTT